jgi:hypothetical protein
LASTVRGKRTATRTSRSATARSSKKTKRSTPTKARTTTAGTAKKTSQSSSKSSTQKFVRVGPEEKEFKELAQGMVTGKYFFSTQIPQTQRLRLLPVVFMPLVFLSKQITDGLKKAKVEILYEEWSKALPRSINGFPIFISFKTLTLDEWKKVVSIANRIQAAMNAAMEDSDT